MKTQLLSALNVSLIGCAVALAQGLPNDPALADGRPATAAGNSAPAAQTPAETEDVIYMSDGRELHGKIISETRSQVVFEYRDPKLNIKTKLTLDMDKIAHIDRNVAVPTLTKADEPAKTAAPASSPKDKDREKLLGLAHTYGAHRAQNNNTNVPSFYIVPMKGQMGTDINSEVYEKVRDDIKARKPDVIVIVMDCQDTEDQLYSLKGREERGLADLDDYRKMVNYFQDDLRDFKQVCWVHDSQGISSTVAMAWNNLYMKSTGRLGGMTSARDQTGFDKWADDDVRGKMTAAFMSWVKGFLEGGHYALDLAEAMVRPEFKLSATWKGREVIWSLDTNGEYIVDNSDKRTTEFRAKDAEDLCVSKGTADSLDDLALLLGYREYRVLDGAGEKICSDYVADWRRAYDECKNLFESYRQYRGWASGNDAVKWLGKAKQTLEQVVAKLDRFKPLETRLARDFGVRKAQLIVEIEQMTEQLRALRARKSTGGGGAGGGAGAGGGMGPG